MPVSATDFQFVRELVRDDSALALADGKEYLVESRLAPLVTREGLGSVTDLVQRLRAGSPELRRDVVAALATHESLFFRDVHPFETLRQQIIPTILEANPGRRLTLWSAAAAGGQEAYSLALLMREHFPQVAVTILATDFSRAVLDLAEAGCFSQLEVNRGLPAALLVKHFDREGLRWRLHDDVRRMVTFRELNLAEPLTGIPPMDVVLVRNVLIYFDREAKQTLLERIGGVMRPEGYLFLGAAETTYGLDTNYDRTEIGRSICYRRRVAP